MRYIVDGTEYESATEAAQAIADALDEDEYDDMLNNCYGEVSICGNEYAAAYALKEVDETAWRCGLADWTSQKAEEIEGDLENMEPGDEDTLYGCSVECIGDEDEEDEDNDGEDDDDDED